MRDIVIYPISDSIEKNQNLTTEKKCFGIDLGTTTTLMCSVDSEYVNLKENLTVPIQFINVRQESPFEYNPTIENEKVASIVGVYKGKPFVGSNLHHLKGHPLFQYKSNMFYHWKLELGIDHHPMYPNAVSDKLNMPYKIAGGILNYIRKSRFNDSPLANTIITVPASFQANQRKDVLKAAKMAKIETANNMLIDEPNAAFLGYFNRLSNEEKIEWSKNIKNKNVLVVDFGGGTTDLSILNIDFKKDKGITISNRAISRYNDLGGQDIDTIIAEELLVEKLKSVFDDFDVIDSVDVKEIILPQLSLIGEQLKIGICNKLNLKITNQDISNVNIENINYTEVDCKIQYNNKDYHIGDMTITANEFKDLFAKLFTGKSYSFKHIDKTISTISSSISDIIEKAVLGLDEIDYVLFVGGSSFNPLLHSFCKEKLLNSVSLTSHEPDKLVAEGAAVYSYFLNVHNVSLISPITSETIGVVLKNKRFYPILERGESLPKKVSIPNFKLQSNLNQHVIIPVCINGVDFPIGEIRTTLGNFYNQDTIVKIEAEVTIDKVFKMKVFADDDLIGNVEFENPYGIGKLSEEELEVFNLKKEINTAKLSKDLKSEKYLLRRLIWKFSDVNNYRGVVETAEAYLKRFDDQDESVLNMLYIGNKNLGRLKAAKKALEKALLLNPNAPYLHYNKSLLIGENDKQEALNYLEGLNEHVKSDIEITCRIVKLKNDLGQDVNSEAKDLVHHYKNKPGDFTKFSKRHLLSSIFEIVEEPYAYVDPKVQKKISDQKNYLDTNNLPF
ncbi:Hsp70 family protein [Polaribacter sp. MED152]|uniref:Hsp70 family protein n=1 Tax=Polaribacter sp. MED152 TaxID=313598 RepID=UPI000068C94A|nr:Hsp70 family protein [Polaribacter sp. MED152]EAQ42506.1 Hsp70 protein [Polaribacter sp. MED152]